MKITLANSKRASNECACHSGMVLEGEETLGMGSPFGKIAPIK